MGDTNANLWQHGNFPCCFFQRSNVGRRRFRRHCGGFDPLLFQMAGDPALVAFYESVDALSGKTHRGTNQNPAVFCNLQRQRFSAGADQFIMFHIIKISWLLGKLNR